MEGKEDMNICSCLSGVQAKEKVSRHMQLREAGGEAWKLPERPGSSTEPARTLKTPRDVTMKNGEAKSGAKGSCRYDWTAAYVGLSVSNFWAHKSFPAQEAVDHMTARGRESKADFGGPN